MPCKRGGRWGSGCPTWARLLCGHGGLQAAAALAEFALVAVQSHLLQGRGGVGGGGGGGGGGGDVLLRAGDGRTGAAYPR